MYQDEEGGSFCKAVNPGYELDNGGKYLNHGYYILQTLLEINTEIISKISATCNNFKR